MPTAFQSLASRLMTVQNNYVLGLASLALLTAPEAEPVLRRDSARMGPYGVDFAQISDLFRQPEHKEDACRSFLLMHMCSLIKDSFELTRHHCKLAGRLDEMRVQPWYHLCRLIRNCIAHNFLLEFMPRDLALMPVIWRGHVITAAMNHNELPVAFFGWVEAWEMFVDIRTFAEQSGV